MDKLTDFSALRAAQTACLRPGLVTNCALSAQALQDLCKSGRLYAERADGGLLLLARGTPDRLYFYVTDPEAAPRAALPGGTVCEYPYAGAPALPDAFFTALGFRPVLTRERRTRPAGNIPDGPFPEETISAQAALDILAACFPPDTGCLPALSELEAAAANGRLLARFDHGAPAAVLHAQPERGGMELRHLAVLPAYRGQGLAGQLVREFTARFGARLCRVWVAQDNAAARRIYEQNGFLPDGRRAQVWRTERTD